jgi:uncharacterized membrane protein YbaN (DUF454 family)
MPSTDSTANAARRPLVREPRRLLLAAAGVVSVAFGAIGAFVPGLPTTIFLIVASYCFTRSCPWLEERLLRTRLFAPYMRFVDGRAPMPPRARVAALLLMWGTVAVSLGTLHVSSALAPWLGIVIVGAACAGTVAIALYGRPPAQRPDPRQGAC